MNIYPEHLIYYDQVPKNFFWKHLWRIGKNHPDSFKIDYQRIKGFGYLYERFYVESKLHYKILNKEI